MNLQQIMTGYEVAVDATKDETIIWVHFVDMPVTTIVANNRLTQISINGIYIDRSHHCSLESFCYGILCGSHYAHTLSYMVEYYQNRHPLMMDLSKTSYIYNTPRNNAVFAGCLAFKKSWIHKRLLLLASDMLPRELVYIVCYDLISVFCSNDCREFPHYADILLFAATDRPK